MNDKILKILSLLLILNIAVFSQTVVEVDPDISYVAVASQVTVAVSITDAANLIASSVTVTYDSSLLEFETASDGEFLSGFFYAGVTSSNTVKVDQAELSASPVNGSGILFYITFNTLATGTSGIDLIPTLLRDNNNNPITATVNPGVINVLAVPDEVWVDPDFETGNCDGHYFGYDAFDNLQDAVDAVAAGGTVNINPAVYNEEPVINKNLELSGISIPEIKSVTVTGSSLVTLNGDIKINQLLSISSGTLETGSSKIILDENGAVNESAGNYLIGNLIMTETVGTSTADFGNIGVELETGSENLGEVTVLRVTGESGNINDSGIDRKWEITTEFQPSAAGREISFSWLPDDDNGLALSDLKLYRSNNGGNTWVEASSAVSASRTITSNSGSFVHKHSIWTVGNASTFPADAEPKIRVNLKLLLQGPHSAGSMTTILNSNDLLPLENPYDGSPWTYEGMENVEEGYYSVAAEVVDWVLIELRTGTAGSTTVGRRACFLLSDGSLAEIDGTGEPVAFNDPDLTAPASYYVVIRHRNHLSVMTASPVTLDNPSTLYDFTESVSSAYGTNSLVLLQGGKYGLFSCDANSDGFVTSTDFNLFYTKFRELANGYDICDWNMDGFVTSSDFNIFYSNFRNLAKSNVPN